MSATQNRVARFIEGCSKLKEFTSPGDIADFFRGLDYKGRKSQADDCLVVRFLKDCVGDPDANISAGFALMYGVDDLMIQEPLEGPLHDFVEDFDNNKFPDLVTDDPTTPKPEPVPA
jgi:hypothetical protein